MIQPTLFGPAALTISEITQYIRNLLESDEILQDVWVTGEISNLKYHSSGHVYLTLRDQSSALRAVIWKNHALRLRLRLEEGMAVQAHGYISIYERSGDYQFYIDTVQIAGEGFLYQEFLRLKARLDAEGLFDESRKRSIPAKPGRIGIVTSSGGAALQDILNTLRRRYPLVEVILAPAAVQGDEAPLQIVQALNALIAWEPDVILVARGGGSLEDLWAFNDERVVRAIAASPIPVISGIGHETDFTLADFAADLRAPTPTAAAELSTPNIDDMRMDLEQTKKDLSQVFKSCMRSKVDLLGQALLNLNRVSPRSRVQNERQRLDEAMDASGRAIGSLLGLRKAHLGGTCQHLSALNPLAVMQRGYAILKRADGAIISSIQMVEKGDPILARLSDGHLDLQVQAKHKGVTHDKENQFPG